MGVSTINPVNLLPAVPGIVLGIAMLVIARGERIARERAGVETAEERPAGKISAAITAVCEQASPQLSVQEAKIVWVATATRGPHRPHARPRRDIARPAPPGRGRLPDLPQGAPRLGHEEVRGAAGPGHAADRVEPARGLVGRPGDRARRREHERPHQVRVQTSHLGHPRGTPVPEALDKVADRTGSRDLRLFSTAVDISQQTGGSLADITENVGQTVRARVEARKTIRSKTSLNRIESQIMVGLPIFMMIALLTISPAHREFYSQPSGWALIALAAVLDSLAYIMMRKMGDIKLD